MARIEDLASGDAVSWSIPKPPQEDSIAHGIIKSLNREDETATIRVWAILENGDHEETDRDKEKGNPRDKDKDKDKGNDRVKYSDRDKEK